MRGRQIPLAATCLARVHYRSEIGADFARPPAPRFQDQIVGGIREGQRVALRGNHYDAAFEEFLRARRTPYVAVDEQRRALLEHTSLKSMDFIVYSQQSRNLLIDVKGRRFPSGGADSGHKWENWATAEDLPALLQWQSVFGADFRALLVFAYHVVGDTVSGEFDQVFDFRRRTYAFYGVWADEYRAAMQTRSASWQTVSVPSGAFRALRSPISKFL